MQRSFDFPADTSVLASIGDMLTEMGRRAGFNDAEIGDIQLAVDEACTNTIIHGLESDSHRTFQLEFLWDYGFIEVFIREYGNPFDPGEIRSPSLKVFLEERPIGGLGVYFIRKLMDEAEYTTEKNGMKCLRMVKFKY